MWTETYELTVRLGDWLLGWLLAYPRDVALTAVALCSGVALALVRLAVTDQRLLRRARRDLRRLGELRAAARRQDDAEDELSRLAGLRSQIRGMIWAREIAPTLAALPVIALTLIWASARLAHLPPLPGETLTLSAAFDPNWAGREVSLLDRDGLSTSGGRRRTLERSELTGQPTAMASWDFTARARPEAYRLTVASDDGRTWSRELLVGQARYRPVRRTFGREEACRSLDVPLRPFRPLGFVPGLPGTPVGPWLVGYLLIAAPTVPALRWVLGIH